MGRVTNKLATFGGKLKNALTSKAAKNVYKWVGNTAQAVLSSELGQSAVQGVVAGLATSALTGTSAGEEVKKAVILNVLGVHDAVPDPNAPSEHKLLDRVRELEVEQVKERFETKHIQKIEEALNEQEKTDLKTVKEYITKVEKGEAIEQQEIEILGQAVRGYESLMNKYDRDLRKVKSAIQREDYARTEEERKIVAALERNYKAIKQTLDVEREAIKEEATQQIVDIGGEIAASLLEEIPIAGSALAADATAVRGAVQIYELSNAISTLTNLPTDHLEPPHVAPHVIKELVVGTEREGGELALANIDYKLSHMENLKKELRHLRETVVPRVAEVNAEVERREGVKTNKIQGEARMIFKLAASEAPGVHCYTSCWDSDYVVIFHVISPYVQQQAFLLCIDLMTEVVHFEDIYAPRAMAIPYAAGEAPRMFHVVMREFLEMSAAEAKGMGLHSERLLRGVREAPLYINSMVTRIPYEQKRQHALQLATDAAVQKHLLRGPLAFQRRALLNALLHGVAIF